MSTTTHQYREGVGDGDGEKHSDNPELLLRYVTSFM